MRVYASRLTPDSVVTYLLYDCERSLAVIVLPSVQSRPTVHLD